MSKKTITITLVSGKNLAAKDITNSSDPYVKFDCNGDKKKSKTIKQNLNPVWNEKFVFEFTGATLPDITAECWDWDAIGSDDFMGWFKITSSDLTAATFGDIDKTYPLQKRKDKEQISGDISIKLKVDVPLSEKRKTVVTPTNPLAEWKDMIKWETVQKQALLAQTEFGRYYRVLHQDTPCVMHYMEATDKNFEAMRAMSHMLLEKIPKHSNIVNAHGVTLFDDGESSILGLILEGCRISLDKWMTTPEATLENKLRVIAQIAEGIAFLHSHYIIFRKVKAKAMQISDDGQAKLFEFDQARLLEQQKPQDGNESDDGDEEEELEFVDKAVDLSNVKWMAPESLSKKSFSFPSDVYSFGCFAAEMLAGQEPLKDLHVLEVASDVKEKGLRPTIPPNCPAYLQDIITQAWLEDPYSRPDMEGICEIFRANLT